MKRTVLWAAVLVLFAAIGMSRAQTGAISVSDSIHFKIPFAFNAGDKLFEAGEYRVTQHADRIVLLTGNTSPFGIHLLTVLDGRRPSSTPMLVFRTYGDNNYFLARVHLPGRQVMQVQRTKAELDHVARLNTPREVTVANK